MEIIRERDPSLINRLSNQPGIMSNIAPKKQVVDWTPFFENPVGCIVLSNGDDAVQVYGQSAEKDWLVSTIFGPTCRGKRALETGYAMREWMKPYVEQAFGPVPDYLPQAKWFYRKLGAEPVEYVESGGDIYYPDEGETMFVFRKAH